MLPELPALKVVHHVDWADGDLLLGRRHIGEYFVGIQVLRDLVPEALVLLRGVRRAGRGEQGLERVRAAGEVTLALVLDLTRHTSQSPKSCEWEAEI